MTGTIQHDGIAKIKRQTKGSQPSRPALSITHLPSSLSCHLSEPDSLLPLTGTMSGRQFAIDFLSSRWRVVLSSRTFWVGHDATPGSFRLSSFVSHLDGLPPKQELRAYSSLQPSSCDTTAARQEANDHLFPPSVISGSRNIMCIVWWSSGCPHCHRLCLVPVPVPPDGQPQQLNNHHNNEPQGSNPLSRSGGPGTFRAQAPAGTGTTNNKNIPHATTRTRLKWLRNPFEPETPCLEVQRIWRCYEVDASLSAGESLRSEMAGRIAWGKGLNCSSGGIGTFAEPDAGQGQNFGPMAGRAGAVPDTGSDSGLEAGSTGVNAGPPAPGHLETGIVNPYLNLNLTHASRRQGSRLPNLAATSVPKSPEWNLPSNNSDLVSSSPPVPDDSSLSAFCTLFDASPPNSPPGGPPSSPCPRSRQLGIPSPSPQITLPNAFSNTYTFSKLFPGKGNSTFDGHSQGLRHHPTGFNTGFESGHNTSLNSGQNPRLSSSHLPISTPILFPAPASGSSSIRLLTPEPPLYSVVVLEPHPGGPFLLPSSNFCDFPGRQPGLNVPNNGAKVSSNHGADVLNRCGNGKGGLESFRLCPFLQQLDASDPEEKHPREECWLTRARWIYISGRKGTNLRRWGEREWFRLLGMYLPIGGRGSKAVMGDIITSVEVVVDGKEMGTEMEIGSGCDGGRRGQIWTGVDMERKRDNEWKKSPGHTLRWTRK